MANSYSSPNFDVNVSTNVAGLTSLKGSAPGSGDVIYVSEGAALTVESDVSCLKLYLGDNVPGSASVKRGDLTVEAGATLTLYDTATNGGLTGEGSLNVITLSGTSASYATIRANTVDKASNAGIYTSAILSRYGKFQGFLCLFPGNANSVYDFTLFDDCYYGLNIGSGSAYALPKSMAGTEFAGCALAILDGSTTYPKNWSDYLARNPIKLTANANGRSAIQICPENSGTKYLWLEMSSTPIVKHTYAGRRM